MLMIIEVLNKSILKEYTIVFMDNISRYSYNEFDYEKYVNTVKDTL
jgi:hypothetical protein